MKTDANIAKYSDYWYLYTQFLIFAISHHSKKDSAVTTFWKISEWVLRVSPRVVISVKCIALVVFVSSRKRSRRLRIFCSSSSVIVYSPEDVYLTSQILIVSSLRSINKSICAPGRSSVLRANQEYSLEVTPPILSACFICGI